MYVTQSGPSVYLTSYASSTRPDLVVTKVPRPGELVPLHIDAHDCYVMVEFKKNDVQGSNAPVLHPLGASEPLKSTYLTGGPRGGESRATPLEQTLDYAGIPLSAQAPQRHYIFCVIVIYKKVQVIYADRAGCIISAEINFGNDIGRLLAVFLALKLAPDAIMGPASAYKPLAMSINSPIPPSSFQCSEVEVRRGSNLTIGRQVSPFQLEVQMVSSRHRMTPIFAHGCDLAARPGACKTVDDAHALREAQDKRLQISMMPRKYPRRPDAGGPTHEGGGPRKGDPNSPKQFSPRAIFGSVVSRFACTSASGVENWTLQLSSEPKSGIPEAVILLYANRLGIPGIPRLKGSYEVADFDKCPMRAMLRAAFPTYTWPTETVTRAIVLDGHAMPLSNVTDIRLFLSALEDMIRGACCLSSLVLFAHNTV